MKTYKKLPDSEESDRQLVRVSEYGVADSSETLIAYGLGASVAIALYAPTGVGGLAHAMLPRKDDGVGSADGKFVDTAIHAMLREMIGAGAGYGTVEAQIAGGADIFQLDGLATDAGRRNIEAARNELAALDVPIVAEDIGGGRGRRVEFDTASGDLVVHTIDSDAIRL
ncbi:chemotaxis protein CheD [Halocatena marina]|uniref:Probable chemoreceptor glutamine deamidase CheD n=1 Tax=Halocatena marina TaxID=2934937 RepID=A0ABD5YMJ0_9EURY|nr:chemotaxis protein CheD [Halocatena marina]